MIHDQGAGLIDLLTCSLAQTQPLLYGSPSPLPLPHTHRRYNVLPLVNESEVRYGVTGSPEIHNFGNKLIHDFPVASYSQAVLFEVRVQ